MKKRIVQIVGIPGGVSDYAHCLGSCWKKAGYELTVSSAFDGRNPRRKIFRDILRNTRDGVEISGVIVHFSGYGYGRRGLCWWLVEELRHLHQKLSPRTPICLVYHELFAGGPIWSSAFWLQPLQRSIAKQLARSADLIWTNTEGHRAWLQSQVGQGTVVQRYPVFSNIGEPQAGLPAFADRAETAIVFGSEGTRRRFFRRILTRSKAMDFLQRLRLVEIGPGEAVSAEYRIPSEFLGKLVGDEVCRLMRESRYGFLEYPGQYLAKSSVMAAYAAHGMLVCNAAAELDPADGLQLGTHYVPFDLLDSKRVNAYAGIAHNLELWYAGHQLDHQATEMIRLIVNAHRASPAQD